MRFGNVLAREGGLLVGFLLAACVYMAFLEPWGHDTWYHLQRLQDVQAQLESGHVRLYFAGNAAQGKGLPVWIFYSQWVYWPALLMTAIGLTPLVALKLVYAVALACCALGCHRLLAAHVPQQAAAFGTLLFMTANYVIGEFLVRSAYAEVLSVIWLPWLLLAMNRSVLDGRAAWRLAVVLFAALMMLAHLLSFMNAGIALLAYAIYLQRSARPAWPRLLALLPLFLAALALTAFFWVPAVIETRYVLGAEGVPTPVRETFLSLTQYLNFSGITTLGFVLTVLTPLVAVCLWRRRGQPGVPVAATSWPLIAGIGAYLFLTLRASEPLYDAIPLLASTLWVWRVLFGMTLLLVLFVTVNLDALPSRLRSGSVLGTLALLGVLQAAALVGWNTRHAVSMEPFPLAHIQGGAAHEMQRTSGFGVDEYLPHPARIPHIELPCVRVRTVAPDGQYSIAIDVPAADANACIHVPLYWNTRYRGSVAGEPIPVFADAAGEILLQPAGRSGRLELRFAQPRYVIMATYLSLVTASLLAMWVVIGRLRRQGTS